jgi:hypothetical protein
MISKEEIRLFVRETLGCTCPEEVFQHVDCRAGENTLLDYEIDVGNRLLIFVASIDRETPLKSLIQQLVWDGINKRNVEDFNRFRLVLLAEKPTDFAEEASAIFQSLGADDKVHLHVASKDDFPALNLRS